MSLLRRIGLYAGVFAILMPLTVPVAVFAQATPAVRPPLSIMTTPLPLNVTTKPGQPVTADIRLKNTGTQQELLKVDLLKFGAAGDTGRPQLSDRAPQDQFFNWVSFSETVFTADPNVWKTIHMTISPPKEAAFGYYYAVLFTRANPDRPTAGHSGVEGGVASLVLLTVEAPGARREAQISRIFASQKVYEFLPAKITVRLHNGGNLHVAPGGTLFIKRGSAQVAAMDFNSERGNILPRTDRVFDMSWNDGFPSYTETKDSNGKTQKKLVWDFSKVQKLRFGRYTAHLVAVYDDGKHDVPIEAEVAFWVIPWRILGGIFLILLLVFGGIWGAGRLVWRALRRQAGVVAVSPAGSPILTDPEPEESSLAASLKRRKAKEAKKSAQVEAAPEPIASLEPQESQESKAPKAPKKSRRKSKDVAAESSEPLIEAESDVPKVAEKSRPAATAGRKPVGRPAKKQLAVKPAAKKLATKPSSRKKGA